MKHNHNPITERGETYCRECGEVLGYDIVSVIARRKTQERFKNNCWY